MKEVVIIAIGGNSLVKGDGNDSIERQYEAVCQTVSHIADMVEDGYKVIVTHGNGPQVGFDLSRAEIANEAAGMPGVPLVNCVANTQGGIGYQIQQAFTNEFIKRNLDKQAVSIITQVEVSKDDPMLDNPTKPIGSFYSEEQANELLKQHPDWYMAEDSGRGYRRVVPSPAPINIVEKDVIQSLIDNDYVVIAAGGGGIPVVKTQDNLYEGIDAVIDKDYATSLLANQVNADTLIITTGVPQVYINFGKDNQEALGQVTVEKLKEHISENQFQKGSMLPKIEASLRFMAHNGSNVIITDPANLKNAIKKVTGTHILHIEEA